METQVPELAEGFNSTRAFFDLTYPPFLAGHLHVHPEDDKGEDSVLIVVPSPTPGLPAVEPVDNSPRIITPGSKLIQ